MALGLILRASFICLLFGIRVPADASDSEDGHASESILPEHGDPNTTYSSKNVTILSILVNLESKDSPTGNQSESSPEASNQDAGPSPTHEPKGKDANSDSNSNSTSAAGVASPRSSLDNPQMGSEKKTTDPSMHPQLIPRAGSLGTASSSPWYKPFHLHATYTSGGGDSPPYGHGTSGQGGFPWYSNEGYSHGRLFHYGQGDKGHGVGGYPFYGHGSGGYPDYSQVGHPDYSLWDGGHGDGRHPGYGIGGNGHWDGRYSYYGHGGYPDFVHGASGQGSHPGYGLGGSGRRDGGHPDYGLGGYGDGGSRYLDYIYRASGQGSHPGYGYPGYGYPGYGPGDGGDSGDGLGSKGPGDGGHPGDGHGSKGPGDGGHPGDGHGSKGPGDGGDSGDGHGSEGPGDGGDSGDGHGREGPGDGGDSGDGQGGKGQGGSIQGVHPDPGRSSGHGGSDQGGHPGSDSSGHSGHGLWGSGHGSSFPGRPFGHGGSGQGGPSGYVSWGRGEGSSESPADIASELIVLGNILRRARQMSLMDAWRTGEVPKRMLSKSPVNPSSHTVHLNGGYLRERDFRLGSRYSQDVFNNIPVAETQQESHPTI